MSLVISLKSEFLKTKRSPTWILTLVMAAFTPVFMLLVFRQEHDGHVSDDVARIAKEGWNFYYRQGNGMISVVFLPMFIILMSSLLPQIEYRNHTWKQVFAAPQSYGKLFIAKFLVYQSFILVFIVAYLLFTGISIVFSGMINPRFNFNSHPLDWYKLFISTSQIYVSILALSALQFCLGLRFKSFLVPIGVGVLLSIFGIINMFVYPVLDTDKFFYNFATFIIFKENAAKIPFVLWSSAACMIVVLIVGFIDFKYKKIG